MPNLIGKTLGKVRVDMFLAKGGMAEVYVGTHTTLHRSVAVKFLKADLQEESDLRERFGREARVIAMLRHPNIVQVFDFDSYQGQPYLVMEYVPGVSLGTYLRELHGNNQRLDINLVNKLLTKIAGALSYAHRNNVIHRDIKPANILLTSHTSPISVEKPLPPDVEPVIADFGLVRFTKSTTLTSTGVITGTPAYMSPEQARGDHTDARTDIYSLGVTVYEMLAGRIPFDADSSLSVLHKQIHETPPPIPGISENLQKVISRALAKDPEERFQTPLQFAEAFDKALTGMAESGTIHFPSAISRSLTQTRQSIRTVINKKKKSILTPLVVIGLGLLATIGALMVIRMEQQQAATPPAIISESFGLLRFQDGTSNADKLTFVTTNMPLPPAGNQYEAWLVEDNHESRISIGMIQFGADNKGSLVYVDRDGRNLLARYQGLEITIEPKPDDNPNPSGQVAFSAALPSNGFMHVRHLLASFNGTPDQTPFLRGMVNDSRLLNDLSKEMLASFEQGDEANVHLAAEKMLNLIVGNQSENHKDWNGNGAVDDPSDGFGLLLNGSNGGYIEGSKSHANLSMTASDATGNMVMHGDHVIIAVNNVNGWTPQLRDLLIKVLGSSSLAEAEASIRQSVSLADEILNGTDTNGNEIIEPIPGEGGALTAYQHGYYMADIILKP